MPSKYSSCESEEYAGALAKNLGIEIKTVEINDIFDSYTKTLKKFLKTDKEEVEVYLQNIQARIRGNILMAFSNKFGHLVLAAGNKSELLTGYCTLYGDMVGGFAVLSDITKTMVYELAEFINKKKEIIPREIIERVPTAELKPDQTDQDTLPPYDILDKIISFLEEGYSAKEIKEKGLDAETISLVSEMMKKNRYKIKQAPLGVKINH